MMTGHGPTDAMVQFRNEIMPDARGWLLDCGLHPKMVARFDAAQLVRAVNANYDGGWRQFLIDGKYDAARHPSHRP